MRNAALFIASQGAESQAGILQSVVHGIEQAVKSWRNRHAIGTLADFDDHLLADLGLTRGDVREALDLPFASDPGRELQFRASRNIRRGWNA